VGVKAGAPCVSSWSDTPPFASLRAGGADEGVRPYTNFASINPIPAERRLTLRTSGLQWLRR